MERSPNSQNRHDRTGLAVATLSATEELARWFEMACFRAQYSGLRAAVGLRSALQPVARSSRLRAINGVSRLHGQVSRRIFAPLFQRWPEAEAPVGHVTNGVHMPSWDSEAADALWTEACGKDRWLGTKNTLEKDMRRVSDASLWQLRATSRKSLIEFARDRLARELPVAGESTEAVHHPAIYSIRTS
jgi:hypothetical protein